MHNKKYGALFPRTALYYAAGSLGGLAVVLTAWLLGNAGLPDLLGVALQPSLEKAMIYRQMVWGGIWGLIFFLLPLALRPLWLKALILTLAPALTALLVVVPLKGGQPLLLDKGILTPLFIYLVNLSWGLVTAYLGWMFGAEDRAFGAGSPAQGRHVGATHSKMSRGSI